MEKLKLNLFDKEVTGIQTAEGYITLRGLFVPFFIEQILMNLMGTVNTLVLGHFSDDAVAAVGAANQVLGFVYTFFAVVSGGASIVISHKLGEKNEKAAQDAAFTSLIFSAGLSFLVSMVLAMFSRPIMTMLNLRGEVLEMAIDYFSVVVQFSFVQGSISAISAILRSYGFPKPAVTVSLIMNAINAAFNFVVVMRPFETPLYGTSGVAWVNVGSRMIGLVIIAAVLSKSSARIRLKGRSIKDFECLRSILKIGIPGGVSNLSYSLSQIVSTSILAVLGTQAISTKIYISTIVFYVYVVGYSLGISTSILVGWMSGAKEYERAYRLNRRVLLIALILNISLSTVLFFLYKPILSLFTSSPDIIAAARTILFIDIFVEIGRAFNHIEDNSLRGAGDVVFPMVISITSCWLMSILFSYVLGIKLGLGLKGAWIAFMMDEMFRGLIMFFRFKSKKWMKKTV